MIDLFPPGILGVDLRGCDCDACVSAVSASLHTRRAPARRAVGLVVEHFSEQLRPGKYGHRLTREQYALPNKTPSGRVPRDLFSDDEWADMSWAYENEDHTLLSDEFCAQQREQALENFDLNMAFFAQIPPADFEHALNEIVRKNKGLRPVTDLRTLDGEEGVYVMVLDEYRQAYIGQSIDIRARIKKHWSGTKAFDRLLWGNPDESVLSVDSFRSLDTTRIFAARTSRRDQLEARIVRTFPADYTVNRIGGGKPNGIRVLFLDAELKRRKLVLPGVAPLMESLSPSTPQFGALRANQDLPDDA